MSMFTPFIARGVRCSFAITGAWRQMSGARQTNCIMAKEPQSLSTPMVKSQIERRPVSSTDVAISIKYSGICHSDIHQAREDWGPSIFPMVPGHEIAGIVEAVGSSVTKFKVGDRVGVGCMVDSCRNCDMCARGEENLCRKGSVGTYNSKAKFEHHPEHGSTMHGGYSDYIVVDDRFVVSIPEQLDLAAAAPLLCAGITTYSPLMHFGLKPSDKLAVVGLGGLGHMGVKFGVAFGADTTVISRGTSKKEEALNKLKAHHHLDSTDRAAMKAHTGKFDFILDTLSAPHSLPTYLSLLNTNGKLVLVGAPEQPLSISCFDMIRGRKTVAGSLIGGMKETQEMLDFCGRHGITCDIEMIGPDEVNEAWERVIEGKVHYRCVIDMADIRE